MRQIPICFKIAQNLKRFFLLNTESHRHYIYEKIVEKSKVQSYYIYRLDSPEPYEISCKCDNWYDQTEYIRRINYEPESKNIQSYIQYEPYCIHIV